MREWQVLAAVVDADPSANEARRFARKFHGYVWLTRYRRGRLPRKSPSVKRTRGPPLPL